MSNQGEFNYVHRAGRSKKRRGKNGLGTPISFSDSLRSTREGLMSSGWWDTYHAEVVPAIVQARRSVLNKQRVNIGQMNAEACDLGLRSLCLGLGSPTKSAESRAQLCVLLDLCTELEIVEADVEIFDPAFEEQDILALRDLGLCVLNENKKGAHVIDMPTLVYMPHCGIGLYERFFRANWSGEGMGRIILVANDMTTYIESKPMRTLEFKTPCVARIAPRLCSTLFPPSSKFPGAFNNTALQIFEDNDEYIWSLAGLPEYSDEHGDDGEVR
ncbi:hypothetical protein OPQ81_006638 [Rhizoctonia solani]|nr:hypothetical protein OPQ81_006638 [Rhizoctonia solani]